MHRDLSVGPICCLTKYNYAEQSVETFLTQQEQKKRSRCSSECGGADLLKIYCCQRGLRIHSDTRQSQRSRWFCSQHIYQTTWGCANGPNVRLPSAQHEDAARDEGAQLCTLPVSISDY